MNNDNIMEIRNLSTSFFTHVGEVEAVRDISFDVKKKEILGIVGESGCGKSATLMSLIQLIQHPGIVKNGEVWFKNKDILKNNNREMRNIRGNNISMIFQDPMTSLNPVYRIGNQIIETILTHEKISRKAAEIRAIKLLEEVGIPSPKARINSYPHELSGGMRQRVMITMALACHPDLLLADEPTTALDVTIQAQILDLLDQIR